MRGDITLNHEELIICERLRALKMSGMADAFEDQMLDPNADLVPFIERFTKIVDKEWQLRYCNLRPRTDADAFQSGRFAFCNGRPETAWHYCQF